MVEMVGSKPEGVASTHSGNQTKNLPTARQPPAPAHALAHGANDAPTNPTRRANAGVTATAAAVTKTTATTRRITAAETTAAATPHLAKASRAMARAALKKPKRPPKRASNEAAAKAATGTEVMTDHTLTATAEVDKGNNLARQNCTE